MSKISAPSSSNIYYKEQDLRYLGDLKMSFSENSKTECKAGEEMKAAFEEFNNLDEELRQQCQIINSSLSEHECRSYRRFC